MSAPGLIETVDLPTGLVHPLDVPAARRWWMRAWITRASAMWLAGAVVLVVGGLTDSPGSAAMGGAAVWCLAVVAARWMEQTATSYIPLRRLDDSDRDAPGPWRLTAAGAESFLLCGIVLVLGRWFTGTFSPLTANIAGFARAVGGWLVALAAFGAAVATVYALRRILQGPSGDRATLVGIWLIRTGAAAAVIVMVLRHPILNSPQAATSTFIVGAISALVALVLTVVLRRLIGRNVAIHLMPVERSNRALARIGELADRIATRLRLR